MDKGLNRVPVHRGLENKTKLMGVEFADIVAVGALAAVMNFFFVGTSLHFWLVYVLPVLSGAVLVWSKRGKPEGHLLHLLRHHFTPGGYEAGAEEGSAANALADKVPCRHFDGDTAVFEDGSLGAGFVLTGYDPAGVGSDTLNTLAAKMEGLLKGIGEGVRLQIFYRMKDRTEKTVRLHGEISKGCTGALGRIRESRIAHLEKMGWRIPEIYFFLRGSAPGRPQTGWGDWFKKSRAFEFMARDQYWRHSEAFAKEVDFAEGSLGQAGLNPRRIGKKEWFGLLFEHFNLERSEFLSPPVLDGPGESLAEQVTLTDLLDGADGIKMGKYRFRTISLGKLPEGVTVPGMAKVFSSLGFDFWMVWNGYVPGQSGELDKLRLQRRVAAAMASGAENVSDLENESKLGKLEDVIAEVLEGRERIVRGDLSVTVWSDDDKELEEKCRDILERFAGMNRAEGLPETYASLDAFLCGIPGVCRSLRSKRLKSGNAAHLMPLHGHDYGSDSPVCLLSDRKGAPVGFDPFDPGSQNYNALIFGGSGSGKSFLVLQLMMMFAGQAPGPKIIWVDNGASSRRLLEVADGRFVELALDRDVRLNLFDLPKNCKTPPATKIKLLLAAVEIMLAETGDRVLPKLEKSLLEECLCNTYRGDDAPTLGKLRRLLEGHDNPRLRDYAKILTAWTGDSPYGRLLDGSSNIDLSADLVTVEIGGLDGHPELQRIMMLAFTDYIRTVAESDTSRRTLLIMDEAWRLFGGDSGGTGRAFGIEAYRTFRKFGGGAGIWCISQNYRDFLADEELADAILPNTENVFVLKQKGIDWEDLRERLQLNARELETVKSLETDKGHHGEFFLMKGEKRGLLRLEAAPLAYWIATTDADDRKRIEKAKRDNPELSTLEMLEKLGADG